MNPVGKIGIFDSGFGGLSVMRHVVARLPQFEYVYLGDTAFAPYGPKSGAEVRERTQQAISFLFDQGCELVIVACNTATCQALRFIQQQFLPTYAPKRRVLGVIIPAAEAAVMATQANRIGVLATQGTVQSRSFAEEIQKLRPEAAVYQQAAPDLVPMIESGLHKSREMGMMLRHYLQPLVQAQIDTLVLGCTHYELIADQIAAIVGPNITIVHEGPVVAERLQDYLFRHPEISHKLAMGTGGQRVFYSSNAAVFAGLGGEFYGAPVVAEQATLS